ncbi:hypothetical protein J4437_00615 [Candidatus Woesearchaeota archaeon]|nr:hypothetical protein [Candidatus Woesearchaeota archaeon]
MLTAKPASLMTIMGDLRTFKQFEPSSLPHVDQLMNERRDNPELQDRSYYTPDGLVYFLEKGTPMLAVTRADHNPVLKHIDDAFDVFQRGLFCPGNVYPISEEDAKDAINAVDTEIFDLTKLRLSQRSFRIYPSVESCNTFEDYGQLQCIRDDLKLDFDGEFAERIKNYKRLSNDTYHKLKLNAEERRLAERIYGKGDDFVENIKTLNKRPQPKMADENVPPITVLIPYHELYERTVISVGMRMNEGEGPFAMTPLLYDDSSFYSMGRRVHKHHGLRGVPLGNFA